MKRNIVIMLCAALILTCSDGTLEPTDTTRPAKVTDLAIDGVVAGMIHFSWTATGDDGVSGRATYYDLRSAPDSSTLQNWGGAIQLQGEPVPSIHGTHETAMIPNTFTQPRYFAIKVSDESANTSSISNIVSLSL